MQRQRSEKPAVGKRGGGGWLSSRTSFRVDKQQPIVNGELTVAGANGGGGGGVGPNCGRISEDTASLTDPASSGSSVNTNTKKVLDDFALPNWEMPSTASVAATGNTTAVLPPAYQKRGGLQQQQQQQQQLQHSHHPSSRELSQQQHRRPHQHEDDIENMLVMCNESNPSIADDITYLTMEEYSDAEGSCRGSSPIRGRKPGLGSVSGHPFCGGGGVEASGARGEGGAVAPYSRRPSYEDDDRDYRDRDGDGDYHHPFLHDHQDDERNRQSGHPSMSQSSRASTTSRQQQYASAHSYSNHSSPTRSSRQQHASPTRSSRQQHASPTRSSRQQHASPTRSRQQEQQHRHASPTRTRQQHQYGSPSNRPGATGRFDDNGPPSFSSHSSLSSPSHRVDNRNQGHGAVRQPHDRHLLDDGRGGGQGSSYGGGGRHMPYQGQCDPRTHHQDRRRPANYDDHQAAELDEDEMLELAMEQSLAETTGRRGGGGGGRGRSQSLVDRPRATSTRNLGNPRGSFSGKASRRNSLEGNPMAMHMPPPPSEEELQKAHPDFIWKKGPNNRYYKCPISELDEDELLAAGVASSRDDEYMSEQDRLEQIEQQLLEEAMEASIAEARKRPGAVKIPPSSHLIHARNNRNITHGGGGGGNSTSPGNRRRCDTAPQYSNQRPLPEDDDDYEEEEEQGKTQAEIEQEELLIRHDMERSLRHAKNGGGDNRSCQGSVHSPRSRRRDSMPTQYADGNWGDRSPVRQEPTISPQKARRPTIHHDYDRRGRGVTRGNSDDSEQPQGPYSISSSFREVASVDIGIFGGGSTCGAFVWKKSKGGRYYKAPIDSIEELASPARATPPHMVALPTMPKLETEAERLERMEQDMLRVAMERSMMEN